MSGELSTRGSILGCYTLDNTMSMELIDNEYEKFLLPKAFISSTVVLTKSLTLLASKRS